jgi:hypothetical protein
MANAIKWSDPVAEAEILGTELNALADNARAITAAIDNETNKHRFASFELNLAAQGSARSSGAYVALYIVTSVDGSSFQYGDGSTSPPANSLVATMPLDAATNARVQNANLIPLPPLQLKVIAENRTGQAFAATLSTIDITYYNEEVQ